jgi:hypothetical protein
MYVHIYENVQVWDKATARRQPLQRRNQAALVEVE